MAMVSSFWNIPVISYWATSTRLANQDLFPTFMRTIANDASGAYFAARLVKQLGYTRCGLLYENSDFGAAFKDTLFTESALNNVTLRFQAYDTRDQLTASRAMRAMSESKLNVIFVVSYMADLPYLAQGYVEEMSEDQNVLFIFLALDSAESTVSKVATADADTAKKLAKMLHGSLYFTPTVETNSLWTNFKAKYAANEFVSYESAINDMFQPNGLADKDWKDSCADASISYALPSSTLGGSTADYAFDIWTYTFDAVIAAGLALCELSPTDPLPVNIDPDFEAALYNKMVNIRFSGLSGNVAFDNITGDRDSQSLRFNLINFKRDTDDATVTFTSVGEYNHNTDKWDIELDQVQWRSGQGMAFAPSETVLPVENPNFLPLGLKIWGYVEVALMNVVCIYCIIWLLRNAKEKVLINSQGSLLNVMCVGCLIASWSVLALTADDQMNDYLDENIACMAAPVMFSIGFQLALLALLGKIYRIFILFKSSKKLRRHKISTAHVLTGVAAVMTIEIVIMICWIVLAPLRFERLIGSTDEFGNPIHSFGQCSGGPACVAFVAVLFGLHAFALVATGYASSRVKDLPVEFQESRYLNLAVLSMSQIYLIAVPTVVATYSNVVGRFVITSTVVFITVGALVLFMIFPKMFRDSFGVVSQANRNTSDEDSAISPKMSPGTHRSGALSNNDTGVIRLSSSNNVNNQTNNKNSSRVEAVS